ncbi:hypothetical protein [Synechococcus sp. RSCCF101]|uniref:hypothetical protein n=1 Tax=Synechococcus sp. RSCCF101 TaxID=2511069 RepID=UPI001246CB6C|nr:hypothetical protein [Synechococcus sp. RSCCF101]
MSPPARQSVVRNCMQLCIHVVTLYDWMKAWRLQVQVVPESAREREGWGAGDKFIMVIETAGHKETELAT